MSLILTCAGGVHVETMYPLIKTESAFNQYAIAVVNGNQLEKQPSNFEEAVEAINKLEAENKNYSVGLGQINRSNFKRLGVTGQELLDPCKNLQMAEKILTECYEKSPNRLIGQALSCYYAGNFKYGYVKESQYRGTAYVERVIENFKDESAIKVPSMKHEIADMQSKIRKKSTNFKKISVKKSEKRLVKNFSKKQNSTTSNKYIFK